MRTVQTEPNFLVSAVHKVIYVAAASITVPRIPEIDDSVNMKVYATSTGAAMELYTGAIKIIDGTFSNGTQVGFDVTITNLDGDNFCVIATVGTSFYAGIDSTNDYAGNDIVLSATPVQGSGKHCIAAI